MDEELTLLEGTVGEQKTRAAVMVGRMNPPTLGHYKVIDLMKAFCRKHPGTVPVVVVVAGAKSSADKQKNPLTAEERVQLIQASGNANGVKVLVSPSAFAGFEEVRKAGFEPYAIAAGSDRADKYLEMLDKYFTSTTGEKLEHVIVPGLAERGDPDDEGTPSEEVLELAEKGEDIPLHLISGSMARLAVKLGYKVAFAKILGVKQSLADVIFKKVSRALGLSEGSNV